MHIVSPLQKLLFSYLCSLFFVDEIQEIKR